jgi:hypothetical protein
VIVATKGIHPRQALLTVGAQALTVLDEPRTVSATWAALAEYRKTLGDTPIGFDWFVLALDVAHVLGAVELGGDGLLRTLK